MFAMNHKNDQDRGEEKVLKPQAGVRLTKTIVKKEKSVKNYK